MNLNKLKKINLKKALYYGGLTLFFITIIGYGIGRASDVIFGIHLSVLGISNGQTVTNPVLDISGIAEHATGISVNGQTVSVSRKGEWKDTVAFMPGYNSLKISASDKFGRTISNNFSVYYKEQNNEHASALLNTKPSTSQPDGTPQS